MQFITIFAAIALASVFVPGNILLPGTKITVSAFLLFWGLCGIAAQCLMILFRHFKRGAR